MIWIVQMQPDAWPWWQILLVVLGIPWGYLLMAGFAQRLGDWNLDNDGPVGLLWPFIIPWKLGDTGLEWLTRVKSKLPEARVIK